MLVEEAKRHEKLRRSKVSIDWDLGHGPDQLQVTTGGIAEQCVMRGLRFAKKKQRWLPFA